jgi:hypothetical protein
MNMHTKIIIALSAAIVFGTAYVAQADSQFDVSIYRPAPQLDALNAHAQVRTRTARSAGRQAPATAAQARAFIAGPAQAGPIGYDSGGAAIFRSQLTPNCTLAMKEQSRC